MSRKPPDKRTAPRVSRGGIEMGSRAASLKSEYQNPSHRSMSSASGGTTLTDVLLRPLAYGRRGQKYAVLLHGEVIVSASLDPEHDACRALLPRGITGTMRTVDEAGAVRMLLDIEKAGKLTVREDDAGLRIVKWRPFPSARSGRTGENGDRRHHGSGRAENASSATFVAAP